MKTNIKIVVLVFFALYNASAKEFDFNLSVPLLDSLILNNQIGSFRDSLTILVGQDTIGGKSSRFNDYDALLNNFEKLKSVSPRESRDYVEFYRDKSPYFSADRFGILSRKAFDHFKTFTEDKDTASALQQLFAAFFFKETCIKKNKNKAIQLFNDSNSNYNAGKTDSAKAYLSKYREQVNRFSFLKSIKDSLKIQSYLLEKKIDFLESQQEEWGKPILKEKFSLSYAFSTNQSGSIKIWSYKSIRGTGSPFYKRNVGNLRSHAGTGHGIQVTHFIRPNCSVALDVNFYRLVYSVPPVFYIDFESKERYRVETIAGALMIDWYLNKRIGLKPFIGFGFGYSRYKQQIEEAKKYWENYQIAYDHSRSLNMILRTGTAYLLKNPGMVLGVNFSYSYAFKDIFFINKNLFVFSLTTGYRF